MPHNIRCIVTTTNRRDMGFFSSMNLHIPTIIANQASSTSVVENHNIIMITTSTKGVGLNRNIGISIADSDYVFLVDDDMVFYDGLEEKIIQAMHQYPSAGVIIFGFDYYENGTKIRERMKKSERIGLFNCLNYGACCTLIKTSEIKKYNVSFSELFGGGCIYGSGEDSLFFLDCVRKGIKVYAYNLSVGRNEYRESTWFTGYNEKFFFDKGAWIACAFPILKGIIKWYFMLRYNSLTSLSINKIYRNINNGIFAFNKLMSYEAFIQMKQKLK